MALAQAEMTEEAFAKVFPGREIVRKVISTTGDRRTDVPLSQVAKSEGVLDKGVFTKELEVALEIIIWLICTAITHAVMLHITFRVKL